MKEPVEGVGASAQMEGLGNEVPYPKPAYSWYVLGVLTLVYVFSFIDRSILTLLVDPIRRDLQISDTQMSLLIGISFAAFYVSFGIPLGRLADSRSRRGLIAAGFACWSLFAAGSGFVRNYIQLAVTRMGVGVGEASLNPAAYSLITDYFPRSRRGIAQGIYGGAIYIGIGIALILGGMATEWNSRQPDTVLPLIGTVRTWQVIFIVVGFTGLLLTPLLLTVKEPVRRGAGTGSRQIPFSDVLRYFRAHWKTYCCHNIGIALCTLSGYAVGAWTPTFFIRHHHMAPSRVGLVLGILGAVFGWLGVFSAGWLSDHLNARGHRDSYLRLASLATLLWLPTGIACFLVSDPTLALILYAPTHALHASVYGIAPAALMQVTPSRMRGQAGAIYIFAVNIIGLGLGPTTVALCTDYLFRDDNMVGYSILIVASTAQVLAGVLLWRGRRHFVESQEAVTRMLAAEAA